MMGLSEMKLPNKRETEGYAHCGYYGLSEITEDGRSIKFKFTNAFRR